MEAGSLILTALPQADGRTKNRPALILAHMPPFGDLLVCGISSQLRLAVPDFDEILNETDPDFSTSGVVAPSVIRLGFISTIPVAAVKGSIGKIDRIRFRRIVSRLAAHLSNDEAGSET